MDLKDESTHLRRKLRSGGTFLDTLLEDWGVYVKIPVDQLASPQKTSMKTIEELRPVRVVYRPPTKGDLFTWVNDKGETVPLDYMTRKQRHELLMQWQRVNARSTRVVTGSSPEFRQRRWLIRINAVINELRDLNPLYYGIIYIRYVLEWSAEDAQREIAMPVGEYYERLRRAKKAIRKRLETGKKTRKNKRLFVALAHFQGRTVKTLGDNRPRKSGITLGKVLFNKLIRLAK